MHVNAVDVHVGVFYDAQNVWHLMNGNPEFAIDVTDRNIGVSARHDVWIDANANRNIRIFGAKMFEYRKIIDVDLNAELSCFFEFLRRKPRWAYR